MRRSKAEKDGRSAAGHITTGLCALFFLAALGLALVLLFRPFYRFEMGYLDIPGTSGYSPEEILANYDGLIRWCMPWVTEEFSLPTFPSSPGAVFHFEQVKTVFRVLWGLGILGALGFIALVRARSGAGAARRYRAAGWTVLTVPLILGAFAASDFNRAFTLFHQLVFRNDYWIFDARTDPVILILPEAYFMHAFLLILALVALGAFLLLRLGRERKL